VLLKLPVRVFTRAEGGIQMPYTGNLKGDDFRLQINGEQRPVEELTARSRSLGNPGAGRSIALSFDLSGNAKPLIDAVVQFVKQTAAANDHLLVRTPVDLYKLENLSADKEQMLRHIRTILENDLLQQQRNKQAAVAKLMKLIDTVEKKLDQKQIGIRSALLFANHFHEGWRHFYNEFLLANLVYFSRVATRFAAAKGEKYLVHFQERDLLPMSVRFHTIHARLNAYAESLPENNQKAAALLKETLAKIERSMFFARDFPMDELLNGLMGVNVGCYMVFLDTGPNREPGPTAVKAESSNKPEASSPGYESILKTIAAHTGGITVYAPIDSTAIANALEQVSSHTDRFYELIFKFNGKAENKRFQVLIPGIEATIYHKRLFQKEEFDWLMKYTNVDRLTVSGFKLESYKLTFTISGYQPAPGSAGSPGIGKLKVDIRLIDSTGTAVYQTGKTLKAGGDAVTISIDLPDRYVGYFKLNIDVRDLATNSTSQLNKYVKLNRAGK
jgi:hypothetical protein